MNKQLLLVVVISIFCVLTQAQQTKKHHETEDHTRNPVKRVADAADDADSSKDISPRCGPRCKNGTIEWPIHTICKKPAAPPAQKKVWCACPSNCNPGSFDDNSVNGDAVINDITIDGNNADGSTAGVTRTTVPSVRPPPRPRNCCKDEKSLVLNGWCVCPDETEVISGEAVPFRLVL